MRCPQCPVAGGTTCLGETGHLRSFCDWAESGDPVRIRHIVARAAIGIVEPVPLPAAPELSPEEYARLRAAELCPHRTAGGCCGSGTRCGPGGRRPGQTVNIQDCVLCVETYGPTPPPES